MGLLVGSEDIVGYELTVGLIEGDRVGEYVGALEGWQVGCRDGEWLGL